jgi:hypothetical protein
MVIVRCLVNPVKERDADDQRSAGPQDSSHFVHCGDRFWQVLENVGEQNGVEAFVLKWQFAAKIDHKVKMDARVKCVCPIDANVLLHKFSVHSVQGDLSAAHVQKPTVRMNANRSFIRLRLNVGNEAGT